MANEIALDTLEISKRLAKEGGLAREHADAIAAAIIEAGAGQISRQEAANFATKADIARLESKMETRFAMIEARMGEMEARAGRWIIGATLAIIGVMAAIFFWAATALAPCINALMELNAHVRG